MKDSEARLAAYPLLVDSVRRFVRERGWDRSSPKDLSMALAVEASELLECFQWISDSQSRALPGQKRAHVREEIGDVLIYLILIADSMGVDLVEAGLHKLAKNELRWPVEEQEGEATNEDGGTN